MEKDSDSGKLCEVNSLSDMDVGVTERVLQGKTRIKSSHGCDDLIGGGGGIIEETSPIQ